MLKKINKNQKGFTLVELIIVIAILGILAALIVPRIMGNVQKAEKSKHISNARTIASEISAYNALKYSENKEDEMIKDKNPLKYEHLDGKISLAEDDFPSDEYVKIIVDSDGNAEIEIEKDGE
ncbi:type II secretion system protein [Herbinix luporum]|uniref:Prepilin-type N-terminal cleavage/methylation domain-containing protein n=1 Tax=Herbinix luporum TaxID=1679721 RepID=A0A0K8J6W8_9FIRM|nr:prepilin-type N-terminal cleavage/methylation domain-containing protein [Herbinix luporum]CUH93144.1 hypothetical protein SD1D_1598 [Herbinix luporum]